MSSLKVFEFAKEVGLAPLALMDKIREWGLPIKSHMAELSDEQILDLKKRLGLVPSGDDKENKGEAKKAVRRKKSATSSNTLATPSVVVVKSRKGGTAKSAAEEESRSGAVSTESIAPAPTRVVRRKREEAGAGIVKSGAGEVAPAKPPLSTMPTVEQAAPTPVSPSIIQVPEKSPSQSSSGVVVPAGTGAGVNQQEPNGDLPSLSSAQPSIVKGDTSPTTVMRVETEGGKAAAGPIRKKEVAIGQSGVASGASPVATQVKKNIVGRMDLSRVQELAGVSSSGRKDVSKGVEAKAQPKTLPTAGARGKTNLRAGFVAVPQFLAPPVSDEDEDEIRKREERRREKVREVVGTVSKEDEAPPVFDASEFKKRELVFQPKKKTNLLNRPALKTQITQAAQHKRVLKVDQSMKLQDVANTMGIKVAELTKVLMKNGMMVTPAMEVDHETLALVLPEFGWEVQNIAKTPEELLNEMAFGDLSAPPQPRAPVVTIMGHVDHGKTSLLDAIRKANVAAGEAGGITQHIGAYQVQLEDGYSITFLDTPGHEAFTAMRARGAHVTDIAVIVVAADDGMMPQTVEAINHAKSAGVPIIVAVNKIDKPGANPERVMQQLTELQIVPEQWGGDTIFVNVSALTKQGIPELLEQIRLVAEIAELKANPLRSGTGVVIEAKLDKGRGPVATLLVKDGSVQVGEWIVAGMQKGRVRVMTNDRGERVERALPGQPVELLGLDGLPVPGDRFDIVKDEDQMEKVIELRRRIKAAQEAEQNKIKLEDLFAQLQAGSVKEFNIVLKTDVHGSLEALTGMLGKLGNNEVKLKIIHSAVGGITESDVLLATTAKGIVIGFNVRPDNKALQLAKNNQVEIRTYSIVYELMEDVKQAMAGLLKPKVVETILGRAEVRNTFNVAKVGTVAGCFVQDGKITRGAMLRLIREGKIIYEGRVASLKRFKDDVREVAAGFECGLGIENFNDIKVGDIIEAFVKEEVQREIDLTKAPEVRT
ncbi:MAG: translation initiation factor IF-2 [Bdellovibrionaceae bacterium]|nr:translation initiation factor IF-2 [Pseudobdellovibrionaceae bacterium]MDW8190434.1 translation initiation factor IF-2 [Pseudobdellovibrionaceae bacterium]